MDGGVQQCLRSMSPALAVVAHCHSPGGHPPELLCPVLSTAVRFPNTKFNTDTGY